MLFSVKSAHHHVDLLTSRRNAGGGNCSINVLFTIVVFVVAVGFGTILSSCGGVNSAVKGNNNIDSSSGPFGSKSSAAFSSGSLVRNQGAGLFHQSTKRQNFGYKTFSQRRSAATTTVDDEQTSRRLRPKFVQRTRVDRTTPTNTGRQHLQQTNGIERREEHHQRIVPSLETNGNSQVVYVNLARVVSDKNDTERTISRQPIKQEGQIGCGETNRNGVPSFMQTNNETLQNRIVGGNKAEPGEFPYQVRLNIRSRRGSSLCGGVIIDKRHILTAAHCITTW
jgi:hypothetical protein